MIPARKNVLVTAMMVLAGFSASFLFAFTATLRTDTPSGADDPSEGDDRIRETKLALVERLDVDHYFTPSGANTYDHPNTGKHRYVWFVEPNNLTVMPENEGALFTKEVNNVAELHWINEQEEVIQLTNEGLIRLTSNSLLGILANDTWFTAIDDAGTGTVGLIKAGRDEADEHDVAVLPDLTRLATDADPVEDTQIVHKKYVDDLVVALFHAYVKVSDVKVNASGGTFSSGAWRTRTINTEDTDPSNICTISDNQITLAAGTYRCMISCPAFLVENHCARLFNVSTQQTLILGTVEYSPSTYDVGSMTRSIICGQFTVVAEHPLEIQHYCYEGQGTHGFGCKMFTSENIYTVAEFWRIPETE